MFRALIGWMDRDWASRKYNSVFAFGQRFFWGLPLFVSIAVTGVLDALGYSRDGLANLAVIILGVVGSFAIMFVSLYRWAVGYGRTESHERAAAEHRTRVTARQALLRRRFKRNGS